MGDGRKYNISEDGIRINIMSDAELLAHKKAEKERIFKKLPKKQKKGNVSMVDDLSALTESERNSLTGNLLNPFQKETVIKTVKLKVTK